MATYFVVGRLIGSATATQVETTNLAVHSHCKDALAAECIRSFPTVIFSATSLLRREEVETGKAKETSIITAVHAGNSLLGKRAFQEPPLDIMYGFRGRGQGQELLSPFEMVRWWFMGMANCTQLFWADR